MIKVGISTACFFSKLYTEDAVDQIAKIGIDCCEVFLSGSSEMTQPFTKDLKQRLQAGGVNCVALHALSSQFEPQLFSVSPRQKADALDIYKRALDIGHALKAEYYVLHGLLRLKKAGQRYDARYYQQVATTLNELSSLAAERQIKLTLENVHWSLYNQVGIAKNLAPYLDENMGYTLDIKQAYQADDDPLDYIKDMGDKLSHVHICGVEKQGEQYLTYLPDKKLEEMQRLANALKEVHYNGYVILEVYPQNYRDYPRLFESFSAMQKVFES